MVTVSASAFPAAVLADLAEFVAFAGARQQVHLRVRERQAAAPRPDEGRRARSVTQVVGLVEAFGVMEPREVPRHRHVPARRQRQPFGVCLHPRPVSGAMKGVLPQSEAADQVGAQWGVRHPAQQRSHGRGAPRSVNCTPSTVNRMPWAVLRKPRKEPAGNSSAITP